MNESYSPEMGQTMKRLAQTFGKLKDAADSIEAANKADDLDALETAVSMQSALVTRVEQLRAILTTEARSAASKNTANAPAEIDRLNQAIAGRFAEIRKILDKNQTLVNVLRLLFEAGAQATGARAISFPEGYEDVIEAARKGLGDTKTAQLQAELRDRQADRNRDGSTAIRLSNMALRDVRQAAAAEYGFDFIAHYVDIRDGVSSRVY
ncbi:hypothetical protein [uncultured Desulfobacter sp.]|uniref:hypothetical protein n=1 Tax=uncultured Desulfobacter sp. TaxID=240139 RepID=UPI002AA69C96|nr:hypothetical protein [uncultured Desulfobacter sp.]